jgi:hypothetical protein
MKNLGLLTLLVSIMFGAASCGKHEAAAVNANSNAAVSKTNENSNQKSEQVSSAETVRLKPSAPCGWFEESLKLKPEKYEQSATMPDMYYCVQVKPLVNQSNFEYHVVGDAENVKYLYVSVHPGARNDIKQDAELQNMLTMAAQETLDKTSGQKLSEEILDALLMSETKDFTLAPSDDKTKPQVKTVSIKKQMRDGKPWKYVKGIELRFE